MHFRQVESAAAAAASQIADLKRMVKAGLENAAGERARANTAGLSLEGSALGVGVCVLGFRVSCFGIRKDAGDDATGMSAEPGTQIPKSVSKIKAG